MKAEEIPSWVPDWEDDNAYPAKTSDCTLGQWAWAFLRRNSKYRADYAHFSGLPSYYPEGEKTSKWSGCSSCEDDDTALRYCDPPALPGETVGQYWERLGDTVIHEMPLEAYLMEKWSALNLPDPSKDDGYLITGNHIEMPPYISESVTRYHVTLIFDLRFNIKKQIEEDAKLILKEMRYRANSIFPLEHIKGDDSQLKKLPKYLQAASSVEAILRFDLRFRIDRQIENAELILEALEAKRPKERVRAKGQQLKNLPKYLRAFDAACAGATLTNIAYMLYPGLDPGTIKQAAYRAVKSGKDLVNEGYKDMLKFHQ